MLPHLLSLPRESLIAIMFPRQCILIFMVLVVVPTELLSISRPRHIVSNVLAGLIPRHVEFGRTPQLSLIQRLVRVA